MGNSIWLRLGLPIAQRFVPSVGPGGLFDLVVSRLVGADASTAVHVTRHADVREVLSREGDFSVRLYSGKMAKVTGSFILGTTDDERYSKEAQLIRAAMRKSDAGLIRRLAAEETRSALDRVRDAGSLDAAADLADVVLSRVAKRFYGLPIEDPIALLRLFQRTSKYIFAFWSDPEMESDATDAGASLVALLSEMIRRRRSEGDPGDGDVLGRFLTMKDGFADGDLGVVRTMSGLVSGSLTPPEGLFVGVVDTLLGLDDDLREAFASMTKQAAAGSPIACAELAQWLGEAERFSVYPPFVYRYAERDSVIAAGTPREKQIPRGSTVVTWPEFAAFDRDVFERPFEFDPTRRTPPETAIAFGHARHDCLGKHLGQIILEEMLKGLFSLDHVRRAAKGGEVLFGTVKEGRYATSLALEFDRGRAS